MMDCEVVLSASETIIHCMLSHSSPAGWSVTNDQLVAEFADGFDEEINVMTRRMEAIQGSPNFMVNIFVAWRKATASHMQKSMIDLVAPMGIGGMDSGLDIAGVVVEDVKDIVAFVFIGPDDVSIDGDMIGNEGVGNDAFFETKIFRGVTRIQGMDEGLKFLPIATGMHGTPNVIEVEDRHAGDGINHAVIGFFQGFQTDEIV